MVVIFPAASTSIPSSTGSPMPSLSAWSNDSPLTLNQHAALAALIIRLLTLATRKPQAINAVLRIGDRVLRCYGA